MSTLFKNLKQNNTVYILDKNDFSVKHGTVTVDPVTQVQTNKLTNKSEVMTDLTVTTDGKTVIYSIPDNSTLTTAGSLILATTEQELCSEVDRLLNASKQYFQDEPFHKRVLEKAPAAMLDLNPALREKMEQEQRMSEMTKSYNDMQELVKKQADIINKQYEAIEKQNSMVEKILKKLDK